MLGQSASPLPIPLLSSLFGLPWLLSLALLGAGLSGWLALIPGALAGYAVLFGFLIYGLAVHARLESWREPHLPASAGAQTPAPIPREARAACAEFSGMGQAPCSARATVDVARVEFRPRFAARKLPDSPPPAERVKAAALSVPAQIPIPTGEFPEEEEEEEVEPLPLAVAYRE